MKDTDIDWDVIELDLKIDTGLVNDYYTRLTTELARFCFDFNSKEYIRSEIYETFKAEGRMGNYLGNVGAWSVSWPIERDIPCPSKSQANLEKYPELHRYDVHAIKTDFYYDATPQKKYKFGLLNKLLETLTDKSLRQILIAKHPPGLQVRTHTDGPAKKVHIPLFTNKDAYFTFGEFGERKYQMEVGKIYIINPLVPHGTINGGNTDRVHLLSRVDFEFIPELINMHGFIE